ncbi:MAG: hypothetical protein OXD50_16840 [Chloroflexi bacterium]|nr:hypothetical protein [Chloroflexota bacterium]
MGTFAAVAHCFNYFVFPCIVLSVVLMLVSILLPDDISGRDSVMTKHTKRAATKLCFGIRAIVLQPAMIVPGLALMVCDRLTGRRQARRR